MVQHYGALSLLPEDPDLSLQPCVASVLGDMMPFSGSMGTGFMWYTDIPSGKMSIAKKPHEIKN